MRITMADTRTLAVAIIQPAADKFYNYTTGGWEQPFNAANHLKAADAAGGRAFDLLGGPHGRRVGRDGRADRRRGGGDDGGQYRQPDRDG